MCSLQVVKEFLKGEYCLYGGSGWWKYEFCYGKKVSLHPKIQNMVKKKFKYLAMEKKVSLYPKIQNMVKIWKKKGSLYPKSLKYGKKV